jgi:hypothetical protein
MVLLVMLMLVAVCAPAPPQLRYLPSGVVILL